MNAATKVYVNVETVKDCSPELRHLAAVVHETVKQCYTSGDAGHGSMLAQAFNAFVADFTNPNQF